VLVRSDATEITIVRQKFDSGTEPRRVGERQGLQTGEERDAEERNAPYEPLSEGAQKAFDRGNYGPQQGKADSSPRGLAKEKSDA
jgi:hypothetical protein